MRVFLRRTLSFLCALAFVGAPPAAQAKGAARIEQSDGVVREYRVWIRVIDHRAVRIASVDGKGTLVVGKAACSYIGDLERCLPYRIVLDQFGKKRPIDFRRGVEYMNLTDAAQKLPRSSHTVPPHGMLLFLVTTHGTYITVRGTIDEVSE
jgi:hypothetical protein